MFSSPSGLARSAGLGHATSRRAPGLLWLRLSRLEERGVMTFFSLRLGVKDVLEGQFPAGSRPDSCPGGLAVLLPPDTPAPPRPPRFPLPPGRVSSENLESRGESFQSPEAYFVFFNSFIETEFMYHNNYHFKCIIQWCLVNLQSCTTVASI